MPADPILRLYAILRGDLQMSPGKSSAQAGHAYLGAYIEAPVQLQAEYLSDGVGTKVALVAPNLDTLELIHDMALARGIPSALITDFGHKTFFNGEPIVTALGLGPARKHEIRGLLKKCKMYE